MSAYYIRSLGWDGSSIYAGTWKNGVWRYDPATGIWNDTGGGIRTDYIYCLTWDGSSMYAGTNGHGVWRYDTATGIWTDTGGGVKSDSVYSIVWNGSCLYASTWHNGVWRYDTATGIWTDTGGGMSSYEVDSLAWDESNLYAGAADNGVWRYDPATGAWTNTGGEVSKGMVFFALAWDGSNLYAGTRSDGVWCYDSASGTWTDISDGLSEKQIRSFAQDDSYLYAGTWAHGVYRYDPVKCTWLSIGGGAKLDTVYSLVWDGSTLYAGMRSFHGTSGGVWRYGPPTWYLAEGCTEGGMDTYILVQNPGTQGVKIDIKFQTDNGEVAPPALQGITIPAQSRSTFKVDHYVTTFNVSTKVEVTEGGTVICERAMYGNDNTWAHDSIGNSTTERSFYLPEGCTDGGMETYILVQNPGTTDVVIDIEFDTDIGRQDPSALQDVTIPGHSRSTFRINDYVTTYNVSTNVRVESGGSVTCERAMYGNNKTWAHDSIGTNSGTYAWYFAEGCTDGGMETYVLVENSAQYDSQVNIFFHTDTGLQTPPALQGVIIPGHSRSTFRINDYVTNYDVSTTVTSDEGNIICERAMYGSDRNWAHDSIGVTSPADTWYLAEGCTCGGIETWVLVQNPNDSEVRVDLTFMTGSGPVPGPQGCLMKANSRCTFNVNDYIADYNVSTVVTSHGGNVICERSMYGGGRIWAHNSIGYAP